MTISQILGAFAITWMTAFAVSYGLGLESFGWLSGTMMFLTSGLAAIAKSMEDEW